jgi:hypothetical protein
MPKKVILKIRPRKLPDKGAAPEPRQSLEHSRIDLEKTGNG